MVRTLLVRGMLCGIVAGVLAFGFGRVFGEPQVDRAIAFESRMEAAKAQDAEGGEAKAGHSHETGQSGMGMSGMGMSGMDDHHEAAEPELVSRKVQAGLGLFTGVVVYCTAFGGLFALVFAFANGRAAELGPRAMAALLAGAGFVAVYLVPSLKYPANPPAVGEPETIGYRTALFFIMLAISVAAMVGAAILRRRLAARHGGWFAALTAAAVYLVVVAGAQLVLPSINEVPEQFPAATLWQFRIASLGMQVVLWATIGLLFGFLTEREAGRRAVSGAGRWGVASF